MTFTLIKCSCRVNRNVNEKECLLLVSVSKLFCFVCWLLIVPATCECISGTDLLRQFYVLPH